MLVSPPHVLMEGYLLQNAGQQLKPQASAYIKLQWMHCFALQDPLPRERKADMIGIPLATFVFRKREHLFQVAARITRSALGSGPSLTEGRKINQAIQSHSVKYMYFYIFT